MDSAKTIWFLYENPDKTVDDIAPFGDFPIGIKAKCVAIPTTAGTGAETTWAVIVTRIEGEKEMKLEQGHKDIIPTYAILDPIFTKSMPKKLTAATGFDALGHCFEGLISNWRTDFSDAMCIHGIKLIFEYLKKSYEDGENLLYREKMLDAASIAGLGFGNSQVTVGHSLAHAFGAVYHVMHGTAVGIFLPYIMEYVCNKSESHDSKKILSDVAKSLGFVPFSATDDEGSKAIIAKIRELQKSVDFPQTLKDIGLSEQKIDEKINLLVDLVNESSSALMTPRTPNNPEIINLIKYALEGKSIDF
jgi:acetaldehyde dehydrogenase/alcohol dehydrogenase